MKTVLEMWPDFEWTTERHAQVEKISLNRNANVLTVRLCYDFFSAEYSDTLYTFLTQKYEGYAVRIETRFDGIPFDERACAYLLQEVQKSGLPVQGYFLDSTAQVEADRVTWTLAHGGLSVLKRLEFERYFKEAAVRLLDFVPQVFFVGKTEADVLPADGNALISSSDKPHKKSAPRKNRLSEKDMSSSILQLRDDEYKLIMGEKPSLSALVSLERVSVVGGRCTVFGKVFRSDKRETRRKNVIFTVSFSDGTGSVSITAVERAKSMLPLERVKVGDTIVVAGEIMADKYDEKCMVMVPRNIIAVNPAVKEDVAPSKRIEMHLHTNMSAMDALPPVTEVIDRAIKYGHSAVAITDHGVLQSYPEAQQYLKEVRKRVPEFKVIYGLECYYVDDTAYIVTGEKIWQLEEECVCFDFETTGLNAEKDRIIEIGAVRIRSGEVVDSFSSYSNPMCPIPTEVTKLTGIDEKTIQGAPTEEIAMGEFIKFLRSAPLIAHNAQFDMAFLNASCKRMGFATEFCAIDTLALSQCLLPELSRHRLDALTKHFGLPSFRHHRAADDAAALASIFFKLSEMLALRGITDTEQLRQNVRLRGYKSIHPHHMILLARDPLGLKNLYQLVTKSHLQYFYGKPRIPYSELMRHREGLLVGSACQEGEIFSALLEGYSRDAVAEIAKKYDYFEIQPRENNRFLIDKGILQDEDELLAINRQIVELGEELNVPVIAAGDVHYLDQDDAVYRDIIMMGGKSDERTMHNSLYFRTTEEMLHEFAYLGEQTAQEVVVENTHHIADMISSEINPIPPGTFTPTIAGADDTLRSKVAASMNERYGEMAHSEILLRAKRELDSIIGNNYAVLYVIAEMLVARSEEKGYHVGSRGSVGSSFIAHLIGISEVNPLAAHYLCGKCKHFEWIPDAGSGFDVPNKECPMCGATMHGDGHNIPFETFLGFKGEKQPDIDLNFSSEYQLEAHRHTRELFGSDRVFKAGTISALQERTAYGFVKKYLEERNLTVNKAEEERLVRGCTGVKRTTGQHPGGMVVIPTEYDIADFTPAQHPADKSEQGVITTHFDFTSLHNTLLKLDELGHDVPTLYRYLEELSGINVADIPMNDPEVYKLFTSPAPLGVSEKDIDSATGTFGIPEMGTPTVRGLLIESQPKTFSDLVQVSGLSHGTDVWANNAQQLIASGTCTIKDVIGTRDSIMVELMKRGVKPETAFEVMELTRRGLAAAEFTEAHMTELRKSGVPQWYVQSCQKIKYMFPKAHAAAYVISAIRLAWFKLNRPLEFYAAYFTVRGGDVDYEAAVGGRAEIKKRMSLLKTQIRESERHTQKDEDSYTALQMVGEVLYRGYEFLPVHFYRSHATRYLIEGSKLRLPFSALKGIGENAAAALYEAAKKENYISADELLMQPGITPSLIDILDHYDGLGDLPRSSQMALF